jgi:hypothetical protein
VPTDAIADNVEATASNAPLTADIALLAIPSIEDIADANTPDMLPRLAIDYCLNFKIII